MGVVISIDAGTTGVRAFAIDELGQPRGFAYREFTQYFPQPGWVEHDANEIWQAVLQTLAELSAHLTEPIAALGVTDQRETIVAWDKRTGEPRYRAIVWQDRRTAARCEQLDAEGHLELVRATTGLVLDPYFSGTKAEWLLTEGGVQNDDHLALGTIDSWLVWKLTGGAHLTDTTNASRTLLFDINRLAWSDDLCELLGVPRSALPEVRPSSGRFGVTIDGLPIPAGIPLSGIAGDQQAALFGQACFETGQAKNTYGTGSFVLMNVGDTCPPPVEGLLSTVAWSLSNDLQASTTYAYEGAIFVTGAAIQWLRDGLEIIAEAAEVGPLVESVPSSDGVVFVPALTGLGSPYWDPRARGTILGITRGTTRAHIARATVEAMVFQTRDVLEAMAGASSNRVVDLRVDGGASVMDVLLQLQADQLGVPVIRSAIPETTALGSAYLAGIAEGVWSSAAEVGEMWAQTGRFDPSPHRLSADQDYRRWQRAVERSRGWEVDDESISDV
jgi:glycerol kinase